MSSGILGFMGSRLKEFGYSVAKVFRFFGSTLDSCDKLVRDMAQRH